MQVSLNGTIGMSIRLEAASESRMSQHVHTLWIAVHTVPVHDLKHGGCQVSVYSECLGLFIGSAAQSDVPASPFFLRTDGLCTYGQIHHALTGKARDVLVVADQSSADFHHQA
jgi:hypothetical protein